MHFRSNGARNRETHCPLYSSTQCCNFPWKAKRHQIERQNRRLLDEFEICRRCTTSLEELREMLCEFKISTEAVGLGIHPDKTKILSNQDKVKAKRNHGQQHQDRSFDKRRQCALPWTENHVRGARN